MPFVRPDVQAFLAMLNSQPGPKMHELDVATARAQFQQMSKLVERPRGALARVSELTIPGDGPAIPARLYAATEDSAPAPLFLFFHGGGWTIGDLETHDGLCAEIARTLAMTVIAVDYRLGPEAPFPAAVLDALAAVRWAAESPAEVGHAVTGLVVGGDSAGGNLSAVVAQELAGRLAVPFLAQLLLYPGVDMGDLDRPSMREFAEGYLLSHEGMAWFGDNYAADPAHHHASPLLAGSERFASLPPALVFTAGLDPLRDQGRAYAAKLVGHGVPTRFREGAGQIHGSFNLRGMIPSAHADLIACLADLKSLIAEGRAGA